MRERDCCDALVSSLFLAVSPEREGIEQLSKMWIMPLKGKYLVWAITGTSRYLVSKGVDMTNLVRL